MRLSRWLAAAWLAGAVLASCGRAEGGGGELSPAARDSLACLRELPPAAPEAGLGVTADSLLLRERRYALDANFEVTADSLLLRQLPLRELLTVRRGERLVVAEFMSVPGDSVDPVWVKVARDQETMGWIRESELLPRVVPTDPVSRFIHFFSDARATIFAVVLALSCGGYACRFLRRRGTRGAWPAGADGAWSLLLYGLLAATATLYAAVRRFAPDDWERFYYDPSLDPFCLPPALCAFMLGAWAVAVAGLAAVDDLFRQLDARAACLRLLGLMSGCVLVYLFFTYASYYYAGYACLPLYVAWLLVRARRASGCRYVCGACGARLRAKGVCPRCGAFNE